MTKVIDQISRFLDGSFSSGAILANDSQDDVPWFGKKFRTHVVIFVMAIQMFSVMALFFWRSSNLFLDRYFNYSIAFGIIYAVQTYNLYTSRVSASFCAKFLVISFMATFCLIFLDPKLQEILPMGHGGLFILPPFSYTFAGRKFGIVTTAIIFMIYIFCVFWWPSFRTVQITWLFHFVLDFAVPILMLSLLAEFFNERILATECKDRQVNEAQARSVFLRIVSHELRTPIHGILASTEILRESPLTSAQRSLISTIQSAGTNAIHMADHILRVSNMRDLEVQSERFDLYLACDQISDGMSPLFESREFEFEFDYQVPFFQSLFIGDVGIIKQIIINLMSNMLNIIQNGKVIFAVNAKDKGTTSERTDKPTHLFTIEFCITGIGHSDAESSIKGTDQTAELHGGIRFAQTIVNLIGGRFELKISPEDPKTRKSSYTFIISIDLQKAAEETDQINVIKPLPLRYISEQAEAGINPRISLRVGIIIDGGESIAMKKIESILMEDFEMKSVQRISIEGIDNEQVNAIIFDTSEIEGQLIEEVCQRAKSAVATIIFITKLLRNVIVSDMVAKSGIHGDKIYFITKPLTQVKLWNGLTAAANMIRKIERQAATEITQKEESEVVQEEEGEVIQEEEGELVQEEDGVVVHDR